MNKITHTVITVSKIKNARQRNGLPDLGAVELFISLSADVVTFAGRYYHLPPQGTHCLHKYLPHSPSPLFHTQPRTSKFVCLFAYKLEEALQISYSPITY
eukprot:scpid81543/ scgid22775/ 